MKRSTRDEWMQIVYIIWTVYIQGERNRSVTCEYRMQERIKENKKSTPIIKRSILHWPRDRSLKGHLSKLISKTNFMWWYSSFFVRNRIFSTFFFENLVFRDFVFRDLLFRGYFLQDFIYSRFRLSRFFFRDFFIRNFCFRDLDSNSISTVLFTSCFTKPIVPVSLLG